MEIEKIIKRHRENKNLHKNEPGNLSPSSSYFAVRFLLKHPLVK